jgi:hypothetical protein
VPWDVGNTRFDAAAVFIHVRTHDFNIDGANTPTVCDRSPRCSGPWIGIDAIRDDHTAQSQVVLRYGVGDLIALALDRPTGIASDFTRQMSRWSLVTKVESTFLDTW